MIEERTNQLIVRVFKLDWDLKPVDDRYVKKWILFDMLYEEEIPLTEQEVPLIGVADRHIPYLVAEFLGEKGFPISYICASGKLLICHEAYHNRTLIGQHRHDRREEIIINSKS